METCMVYPDPKYEKGISKFTLELNKGLRSQKINVDEIIYVQGKPKTFFSQLKKIKKYPIIHIQHEYNLLGFLGLPFLLIYFYLGIFKKNKLITTMHTVLSKDQEFKGSKLKTFIRKRFYPIANYFIKRFSDKIIVYSKHFQRILIEDYHFPKEKVIVLPLAIVDEIKPSKQKKAREKLGFNQKEQIYLMIGTMNPYHDYTGVVKVGDKIPGKILIITSASAVNYRNTEKLTNALNELKKAIKDKNLEGKIELRVGFVPFETWWDYFSASDLVLMPYEGGVGSGVFFDAMLMRKPVVATNVPFFNSVAKDYGCLKKGETSKFPEMIKESMKKNNYKKMVSECERFVKENKLSVVSKKYKKLYEELI